MLGYVVYCILKVDEKANGKHEELTLEKKHLKFKKAASGF